MSAPRIIVGMSGGVDSSVAALLLRDQALADPSRSVAGLFMRNWADDGSGDCRAEDDRREAVAVCGRLGLPIHFRDFSGEYWDHTGLARMRTVIAAARSLVRRSSVPPKREEHFRIV